MAKVIVPKIFKELFIPNHTEQEKKKFTPQYKAEIRRRLLRGEEIKNGVYTEIEGNVVNITTDELLDEQLDQTRLVAVNSPVDNYPPLTEFKNVYFTDGGPTRAEHYISGEPTSTEYVKA